MARSHDDVNGKCRKVGTCRRNAAESHRKLAKHAQQLASERAGYQQAYDDLARTAEAQQKLIVELQRIVDEQREQLEVVPLKVRSPEQHSFKGPSAPSRFHDDHHKNSIFVLQMRK